MSDRGLDTNPEEGVQRAVLHVLGNDHHRFAWQNKKGSLGASLSTSDAEHRLDSDVATTAKPLNYPTLKYCWRTLCYNSLQADDVGMVELGHDGGFGQEIPLLLLRVARLERFQRNWDVPLSR